MNAKRVLLSMSAVGLAVGATLVAPATAAAAADGHGDGDTVRVQVRDRCDPATFNAAFGPGSCVRSGGTTLNDFFGQLIATHQATGWDFTPSRLEMERGDRIVARNVGGEFHTFTEVAHFGGGCVDPLNAILGLRPVPECLPAVIIGGQRVPKKFLTTGLSPGQTLTVRESQAGTERYQCLVHPWMRAVVHIEGDEHGHGDRSVTG